MREVCVLGLGLIGGSLLRAATEAGRRAWGCADSPHDVDAAAADGFDTEASIDAALVRAARRDALLVLAVPPTAAEEVLTAVRTHAPNCLLTDVTSVKQPVAEQVARLTPGTRYVPGHPMAGSSSSGWQASTPTLFRDAAWVVCPEPDTDLASWAEVARLAFDSGAHVIPASASDHDVAVARISHLPHILAAVLAGVGAHGGPLAHSLAAGSFADGTRVAATRPELTRAMTEGNRDALLPVLDEALGLLGAARGSLASTGSLGATLHRGHDGVRALSATRAAERVAVQIDLAAPEARNALLAAAEQGGAITSVEGMIATGLVPAGGV